MVDETKGGSLFDGTADNDFPLTLLKANKDFEAALANCNFIDETQASNAALYGAQLRMFDLKDELQDATNFLNATLSVNSRSRAQALQASAGMVFPSISGMSVSKEEMKYMADVNLAKLRHKHNSDKEENE